MKLHEIKAIVFDLDGTLYEDTHHFRRYAEIIKNRLAPEVQESFMLDYDKAVAGTHTLKIGRIYDAKKDFILIHDNKKVSEGFTWDGTPLAQNFIAELYPNEIDIDMQSILSVGDLWWIPGSIGMHYGLDRSTIHDCFLEVREYMMSEEFVMEPVKDFRETLEYLKSKIKLILLTNSDEPSSETLLKKLGIQHVFHKKIFQGKKPSKTLERFEEIRMEFNLSFNEILSVGDNYMNEIHPVIPLGCKTIYIDNYRIRNKGDADYIVYSISEVVEIIKLI
jgi:FMN phosphatase YigB (HAD superfamily)